MREYLQVALWLVLGGVDELLPAQFQGCLVHSEVDPPVLDVDLDERERALLEQVRFVDYQSILCEVENAPPRRALFFPKHMSADRRGHLLVLSQPGVPDHVCVAYAIGGDGDVVPVIAADLEKVGARLRKVIAHKRWSYFPHLASHQLRAFYQTMEGLQGARNTCYAGEVMSFSTVENVSEYSRDLVDRFF